MADTELLEDDQLDLDLESDDGPEQTQSWLLLAMGIGTVGAIVVAVIMLL